MNTFSFTGRLARDPERRETKSGKFLTVITLAVSRDNTRNEADFIHLTAWGNLSERMQSYGAKGRLLEIEGYVRVKPFPSGPGGHTNPGIQFVAEKFKFLDSPKGNTEIMVPDCETIDVDEFFFG